MPPANVAEMALRMLCAIPFSFYTFLFECLGHVTLSYNLRSHYAQERSGPQMISVLGQVQLAHLCFNELYLYDKVQCRDISYNLPANGADFVQRWQPGLGPRPCAAPGTVAAVS
jgi:hypothetical protein